MYAGECEAELYRKEIIAYKSHEQNEIVDDLLNGTTFDNSEFFLKLTLKILSENVDEDELEKRCS